MKHDMKIPDTVINGIQAVMNDEILCFDDIAKHVDFEEAMKWLRVEGDMTDDPAKFLEQYWPFIHKTSYAWDMSDFYEDDHPVWNGEYQSAAKHVLRWDLINSPTPFSPEEEDDARAKQDFDQWIKDLIDVPVRWRLAVCKVVAVLFNSDGGMSKDGNFDMGSPSDAVIATLDEPYRTMLSLTGGYTIEELQSIVESTLVKRESCELPQVDLTSTGPT